MIPPNRNIQDLSSVRKHSPIIVLLLDLALGRLLGLELLRGRFILDILVIGVDDQGCGGLGSSSLFAASGTGGLLDAAAGGGTTLALGRGIGGAAV